MNVANSTPKPSDTAIGFRKAASRLRFHVSGARPKKVVSEVSRMGRKRWTPASRTASARPADRVDGGGDVDGPVAVDAADGGEAAPRLADGDLAGPLAAVGGADAHVSRLPSERRSSRG